jgi:hypothetical protein
MYRTGVAVLGVHGCFDGGDIDLLLLHHRRYRLG